MRTAWLRALLASASACVTAGCTSGAVGSLGQPTVTQSIPTGNALQLAVGVATVGLTRGFCPPGGAATAPLYGLNVVTTYRSTNGSSAVLYDVPSLTGPAGFHGDVSTATIFNTFGGFSTPINANPPGGGGAVPFVSTGSLYALGVFGYGFIGESLSSASPVYENSALPAYDYAAATSCTVPFGLLGPRYIGGPPAWPAVNNGLFSTLPGGANPNDFSGFVGYNMGFFDYLSDPVALPPVGTYTLSVAVPVGAATAANATLTGGPSNTVSVTATASLHAQTALPLFAKPSAIRDPAHSGGLLITATVPSGVTQAFAEIRTIVNRANRSVYEYYTVALPTTNPGQPVTVTLPPALGLPLEGQTTPTPSIPATNSFDVYAVGFDYDAYGPSYPYNAQQRPVITGPNGQSDVTTSDIFNGS